MAQAAPDPWGVADAAAPAAAPQDPWGVAANDQQAWSPSPSDAQDAIHSIAPGATVTSQYRSPEKNAAVGGVADSMHLDANATDFVLPKGKTAAQVKAELIKQGYPVTEFIDEGTHVHWGWGPKGKQTGTVPADPWGVAGPNPEYPDHTHGNYGKNPQDLDGFIKLAKTVDVNNPASNGSPAPTELGPAAEPDWSSEIAKQSGKFWGGVGAGIKSAVKTAPAVWDQMVAGAMQQVGENPGQFDLPGEGVLRELGAQTATPAQRQQNQERQQQIAAMGQKMYARAQAEIKAEAPGMDAPTSQRLAYQLTSGTIQMAPLLAATLVTGSPAAGGVIMAAQADASKYGESRASGRSADQAAMDSAFTGITNGVLGSMPLGTLMKPGQTFLQKTLQSSGSFGAISVATEALQLGYDKGLVTPDMTLRQAWDRISEAGIVGLVQGAFLGGGHAAVEHAVNRYMAATPQPQERVEPAAANVPPQEPPGPPGPPGGPGAAVPANEPNAPIAQTMSNVAADVRSALGLDRPGFAPEPSADPWAVTAVEGQPPAPEAAAPAPATSGPVRGAPRAIPADSDHAAAILARSGGIANDEGHDLIKGRGLQQFIPGVGDLVRPGGMSIDRAGEVLWNEGFWGNPDTTPRPSENQVLQLLEGTRRDDNGKPTKVYAADRQAEIEDAARGKQAEADNQRIREEVAQHAKSAYGFDLSHEETDQIMADMGQHGISPGLAVDEHLERLAAQEVHHDHEETGRYPEAEDVPFGDEPAVADRRLGPGLERQEPPGGNASREGGAGTSTADLAGEAGSLSTERGAEGFDQTIIPGAERSAQQLAQSREAAGHGRITSRSQQREAGGLFEDKSQQTKDLFQPLPEKKPFYSVLTRAIEAVKTSRAPAKDWAGLIDNLRAKGVKQDEIDWSGVKDWLKDQTGPVTKDQILQHLRENEVQVQEIQLGKARDDTAPDQIAQDEHAAEFERLNAEIRRTDADRARYRRDPRYEREYDRAIAEDTKLRDQREALHGRMVDETMARSGASGRPSKYGTYTVPGGENYRELLLTVPERVAELPQGYEVKPFQQGFAVFGPDGDEVAWGPTRGGALANAAPTLARKGLSSPTFRSGHWDEPNVLAHVRFDDRTGPNGEKVLHVAEIQSDWHQAGRRRGYTPRDVQSLEARRRQIEAKGAHATPEEKQEWVGIMNRVRPDSRDVEGNTGYRGVPDAPFKSSWHELAMKRVLRYAAEDGYDRVSWDTGETNAERYDLSKQISHVLWFPKEEGYLAPNQNKLEAFDHQGHKVIEKKATPEELPDLIGKEAADRLLRAESTDSSRGRVKQLQGLDLKVGGEGMKGFYDKILPDFMRKYVKKWGAKVERSTINKGGTPITEYRGPTPTPQQWADVSEAIKARPSDQRFISPVTGERQGYQINRVANETVLRDVRKAVLEDGKSFAEAMSEYGHDHLAEIFGGELVNSKSAVSGADVHSVFITQEMRRSVMEGQPLFQPGRDAGKAEYAGPRKRISDDVTAVLPEAPSPAEQRVLDRVAQIAQRILPGADITAARRLELSEAAYGRVPGATRNASIAGVMSSPDGLRRVIAWSLESLDAPGTLRHEAVHYLKDLLAPEEWNALVRGARVGDWIGKYDVNERWPNMHPEGKIEEAIAEAAAHWRRAPQALPKSLHPIFEKIANFLAQVRDYLRKSFGKDVTADNVFSRIMSGEVGRRAGSEQPSGVADKFDLPATRPPENLGTKVKKIADKVMELGGDALMHITPMSQGTPEARAVAKDFANMMRLARWHGNKMMRLLKDNFSYDRLAYMWQQADEESVLRQTGQPTAGKGLDLLDPEERRAVQAQQADAQAVWNAAKEQGMVEGEGLPSYVPRMMVEMAGNDVVRLGSSDESRSIPGIGRNVRTSTPQMKQRKYMTTQETEQAGSKKFETNAHVVRDIRTLPLATMRLREAVAGRALINKIKEIGNKIGDDTVVEGHEPAGTHFKWFTLDNPAFKTWRPKLIKNEESGKYEQAIDQNGDPQFEKVPLYVRGDFEGPLRAVLSTESSKAYQAIMNMKGRAMTAIMYSPLIHNMVEWGRALPGAPGKVLTGIIYFEGNKAKNDPAVMTEAIMHGFVPIGHQAGMQDITSIANADSIKAGRSLTSHILGFIPGLFSREAQQSVYRTIDAMGDFWHNTLLWDRVGDLQMGLYVNFRDHLIKAGTSPDAASYAAAHWANRYAGALPLESMSNMSRKIANLAMFSRTYTLGNLGAMKDMLTGLPRDIQAQIERDGGPAQLKGIKSIAVRKAISIFLIDTALFYASNAVLQSALAYISGRQDLSDVERGYVNRALALSTKIKESPSQFSHIFDNLQSLSPTSENEAGKENRFLVGYDKDGTAIYGRNPAGKIGEEYINWTTSPIKTAISKMSTFLKPAYQTITNDAGFGRHVYDPNAKGFTGMIRNLGNIVENYLQDQVPIDSVKSAYQVLKGKGSTIDTYKTLGPLAGITFSKGAAGGPAVGELYNLRREHDAKVSAAMPGIVQKIKDGDIAGARKDMHDLDIPPGLQNYYVRVTKNPRLRLNTKSNRQLLQHASPEERARINDMRGAH